MTYGLSEHTITKIQEALRDIPAVVSATIYGSRARGDYHSGSDIDLTLSGEELTYTDLLNAYTKLDDLMLPYTFDLSIFSRITNPLLRQNILRDGKELYRE
ncbi:MAG: nucleotidyltransferase domain-containing protein [Paludibacteraceae bacterium]|nr:nucleotidyltransferase domain-containing protein [Paludibacteraceae bacterium]